MCVCVRSYKIESIFHWRVYTVNGSQLHITQSDPIHELDGYKRSRQIPDYCVYHPGNAIMAFVSHSRKVPEFKCP